LVTIYPYRPTTIELCGNFSVNYLLNLQLLGVFLVILMASWMQVKKGFATLDQVG